MAINRKQIERIQMWLGVVRSQLVQADRLLKQVEEMCDAESPEGPGVGRAARGTTTSKA